MGPPYWISIEISFALIDDEGVQLRYKSFLPLSMRAVCLDRLEEKVAAVFISKYRRCPVTVLWMFQRFSKAIGRSMTERKTYDSPRLRVCALCSVTCRVVE